jgi:hypothetical protein
MDGLLHETNISFSGLCVVAFVLRQQVDDAL